MEKTSVVVQFFAARSHANDIKQSWHTNISTSLLDVAFLQPSPALLLSCPPILPSFLCSFNPHPCPLAKKQSLHLRQ